MKDIINNELRYYTDILKSQGFFTDEQAEEFEIWFSRYQQELNPEAIRIIDKLIVKNLVSVLPSNLISDLSKYSK